MLGQNLISCNNQFLYLALLETHTWCDKERENGIEPLNEFTHTYFIFLDHKLQYMYHAYIVYPPYEESVIEKGMI